MLDGKRTCSAVTLKNTNTNNVLTNTVFKTMMACTRENVVCSTELLQIPQSLRKWVRILQKKKQRERWCKSKSFTRLVLWSVDVLQNNIRYMNMSVDIVVENFSRRRCHIALLVVKEAECNSCKDIFYSWRCIIAPGLENPFTCCRNENDEI